LLQLRLFNSHQLFHSQYPKLPFNVFSNINILTIHIMHKKIYKLQAKTPYTEVIIAQDFKNKHFCRLHFTCPHFGTDGNNSAKRNKPKHTLHPANVMCSTSVCQKSRLQDIRVTVGRVTVTHSLWQHKGSEGNQETTPEMKLFWLEKLKLLPQKSFFSS